MTRTMIRHAFALLVFVPITACAAAREEIRMPALFAADAAAPAAAPEAPKILDVNHFNRDSMGTLSEADLRNILQAPVFLEEKSRLGIVPVSDGYGANGEIPVVGVPGALAKTLDDTGQFEIVSEVSTDFPATGSIAGLRELAARYRCDYLLLYRHRFVDRVYASGWAWTWATLVGQMIAPANVLEAEGVLEATLFDVKTGTILFTTFERVKDKKEENVLDTERKQKELREKLLADATKSIGKSVVEQIGRLAAARKDAEASIEAARSASMEKKSADESSAPMALVK
jgi:hypothetical protein